MYRDILTYQLHEKADKAQLLAVAADVAVWMAQQPGFVDWQINVLPDGKYVDIVSWNSAEAAQACEQTMSGKGPDTHLYMAPALAQRWMECYDMTSVQGQKATQVELFHV